MNLIESFRIAWRSIKGHKLRSTLTTLGVIIGIAAVITFVTLGTGVQEGVLGDVSPDDRSNVYVWAAPAEDSGQGPLAGAEPVFTRQDAAAVSNRSGVEEAYVWTAVPGQSITRGNRTISTSSGFSATGPSYFDDEDIGDGRRFDTGADEVVVNPQMAGQFERNLTVGDRVTLGLFGGTQLNATVVGILENSDALSAFEGFNPSPRLYIPASTLEAQDTSTTSPDAVSQADLQRLLRNVSIEVNGSASNVSRDRLVELLESLSGGNQSLLSDGSTSLFGEGETPRYRAMIVESPSADESDISRTKEAARTYLESDESDAAERAEGLTFQLKTSTELLSQLEDVFNLLQNFIVGIAGISLLVGSIGIANIMLVSVTERTREIGIMKAVGAQRRDILGLFLVEAIILGVIGAVFGTLLGLGAGFALAEFVGVPYVFPTTWAAVAVVVGILVGVLAGLYPAWSASRTDPIDALRYE
jgi:putative ABC transport system permease protein